jgi:hypothetical protein
VGGGRTWPIDVHIQGQDKTNMNEDPSKKVTNLSHTRAGAGVILKTMHISIFCDLDCSGEEVDILLKFERIC